MAVSKDQMFRILKEHYVMDMSQKEIAKLEKLSAATISRLIREARDQGYVRIELNLPDNTMPDLEKKIVKKYGIRYASVVSVEVEDQDFIIRDIAQPFSDYLNTIMEDGDVIGLSWGRTLSAIAVNLQAKTARDVTFVSMSGGVSMDVSSAGVEQTVRMFARAYDAQGYSFPLPVYMENKALAEALMEEQQFTELFELIRKVRIAVFSVGPINTRSLLHISGYHTFEEMKELEKRGFVGDICGRLYKADGSHDESQEMNKSIGITLDQLKEKEHKLCIVSDAGRAEALHGALRGGYIDCLFADELTAKALLKLR